MTTAGMILQGDLVNIGAQTVATLNQSKAVLRLPPLTRDAVFGQVQSSFASLHSISIGDVLMKAWAISRTLRRAADKSLSTGQPQPVHLDGYAAPVDYQPELDVYCGTKRIATVHFGLCVTVELFNFDGVVERARLVRLRADTLNVTVSLSVENRTVASRKAGLNLMAELPLPAEGVPLRVV